MKIRGLSAISLGVACAAITVAPASNADFSKAAGQATSLSPSQAISSFQALNPRSGIAMRTDGSIGRVYGKAFSHGQTGAISASRFLASNLSMWGVPADELVAEGPFDDARNTQQIGYEPDFDTYKFTGHYFKQIKDGLPVFRSKLVLLTRNEANNPLVLASSMLHDLSGFSVEPQLKNSRINHGQVVDSAQVHFGKAIVLESSERMVYAGTDASPHAPVLADVSNVIVDGFEKFEVVTDAVSGEILHTESLICTIDVTGNASGLASDGPGADICADEITQPLPYLHVEIAGGATATADANGDFTIPHGGAASVNVNATLTGEWFRVIDFVGSVESVSDTVTPPGPANLNFNALNNSESTRAQINAYVQANVVRDYTVAANPAYPGTGFQMNVTVNRNDGFCPGNAWYDSGAQSINFCSSSSGNANTAWTSVIHHEYGHHIVSRGGSGQGQYGEGFGDVMSAVILDDNRLGLGFFNNCGSWLRDADNNLQYPCATDGHACAGLLSGCVWETRNEMVLNGVSGYTDILNFLAVNSVLVHSGSLITPQITIDWLTLDDDDADIGNGTPHYNEIAAGFAAKNMDAPPLNLYSISFPDGRPEMVSPDGGDTMAVDFTTISASVDPASVMLMVDSGSGYVGHAMSQVSANQFEATFPAVACGTQLSYYIESESNGGAQQNSPIGAPADGSYSTIASFGAPTLVFEDDFQSDQGWTVSGNVTTNGAGRWERATPASGGTRGEPANDNDGSGLCYVTGNGGPEANNDVDNGTTILTSPVMDASGDATVVSYARWYDNTLGSVQDDAFVVQVSDDAGSSWSVLESVGPTGSETAGGWIEKEFSLSDVPGFALNNQFQIRFSASDNGTQDVVEAGVDAVSLSQLDCSGNSCDADLTGDGELDFFDVSEFLALFGSGDLAADFNNDGALDFFDVSEYLALFGAGCP